MNDAKPVNVSILEKEYVVACKEGERESLHAAVQFLNDRMTELKKGARIVGSERIAVMAALNITHEYLEYKRNKEGYTMNVDAGLRRLQDKIEGVLSRCEGRNAES